MAVEPASASRRESVEGGRQGVFESPVGIVDIGPRGATLAHRDLTSELGDDPSDTNDSPRAHECSEPPDTGNRFLACPYFIHDPKKYQSTRTCTGPGWNSISRVK